MAAPSTVYKDFKTRRRKAGTPDVDIDLFIAKFLQNTTPPSGDAWGDGYFNSTDTEAQKIAKIKDIFKIDGWVQVAKGTATTPDMGFIGYCNSRTSGNGLYHKTERFSGVRVPTTAQASAELLNDAGLNVKGTLAINSGITNTESDLANNGFKITLDYRSSFYNATTAYGVRWRKQGDTTYNTITIGTLAEKIKEVKTAFSVDVDPLDILYVEAPYTYEVLAFITNSEGTTESQMNNVAITPIAETLAFGTTTTNAHLYGTNATYYRSRRIAEGATLYSNSSATIPVGAGFYMDKSGSAPFFYYECDSNGAIIGIGEYNPLVQRVLYEPSGWGSTEANAISDANSTSWVPKYTIYFDPNDNLWYANDTGITLASDGYWLVGDSEFSYESIYLINGVQQT